MARNIIFDLGGVVLDWNPDAILAGFYEDAALRPLVKAAVFQHPDWLDLDRGVLEEGAAIQRIRGRIDRPEQELQALFAAVRASLVPKPETLQLLERLDARGVPLYCLSNMPAGTAAWLRERHSFFTRFRGIVISGEERMMKPERGIFELLLHRFGLDPRDTLFVDDSVPNVVAARALGMQAVLFTDAVECGRELDVLLADGDLARRPGS